MTFKEFVDDCKTIDEWEIKVNRNKRDKREGEYYISRKWVTGGMTGGSCWGGEPYRMEPEKAPDFTILDQILEKIAPKITFLQYKKIASLIIETEEDDNGYYGNSTDYAVETLYLKDLYNYLVEAELVNG